jgi:hypothetical protein
MTTPHATAITLALPDSAELMAALQAQAEAEVAEYVEFTIETPEEYVAVDAALTDVVHRKDRVIAMRASALGPLEALAKTIRGWFAPALAALEKTETRYKGTMGAYEIERRKAERAAREAGAAALTTGEDAIPALTAAQALGTKVGRATTKAVWKVERIIRDMLPAEYLIPDEKKINAIARAHSGDEPPIVPGVVFKQEIEIGARR